MWYDFQKSNGKRTGAGRPLSVILAEMKELNDASEKQLKLMKVARQTKGWGI